MDDETLAIEKINAIKSLGNKKENFYKQNKQSQKKQTQNKV